MLEQTERISFRISSVLSKVAPEPDPHTGSDQKVLPPMGSGVASLHPPPLHPLASPVAAPDPTKKIPVPVRRQNTEGPTHLG